MRIVFALVFALALLSAAWAAADDYVAINTDRVNIRAAPDRRSPIVAQGRTGDVFVLEGAEGEWYAIRMFNGAPRYVHQSLADPTAFAGALPTDPEERRSIFRALWRAENRATAAADKRVPMWKSVERHMDYEALMDDRLALEVLRRNKVRPPLHEALREEGLAKNWWW